MTTKGNIAKDDVCGTGGRAAGENPSRVGDSATGSGKSSGVGGCDGSMGDGISSGVADQWDKEEVSNDGSQP